MDTVTIVLLIATVLLVIACIAFAVARGKSRPDSGTNPVILQSIIISFEGGKPDEYD